jgi:adenylate kinase family enzyme
LKIYIVGSVASGKSTLAKRISKKTNILYHSLDEVVHQLDKYSQWGNSKRPTEERDLIFSSIMQKDNWIIEDVGRPCFEEGFKQAETIILLEPSTVVRNQRIILRWIRQNLGIEKCVYKPNLNMLRCMLQWSKDYDLGKDKLKERLTPYQNKVIILKSNRCINHYVSTNKRFPK